MARSPGYVSRLRQRFTGIAMDLRGRGESDLPEDPADYAIDKLCQDILAVADACEVERFSLWGIMSGFQQNQGLPRSPFGASRKIEPIHASMCGCAR